MTLPFRIAVFASGEGSNFLAVAEAVADRRIDAELALLVCDRPQAEAIDKARRLGIETFAFQPKDYARREDYEAEIAALLQAKEVGLIVLAGYMRLITPVLLDAYAGRIVNVHPSLLPAFPGIRAVRQALEYGAKVTGVTIHFVDAGLDSGPVIAQRALDIADGDTEESLLARIHSLEHELYPQAIGLICGGGVALNGRKVTCKPQP